MKIRLIRFYGLISICAVGCINMNAVAGGIENNGDIFDETENITVVDDKLAEIYSDFEDVTETFDSVIDVGEQEPIDFNNSDDVEVLWDYEDPAIDWNNVIITDDENTGDDIPLIADDSEEESLYSVDDYGEEETESAIIPESETWAYYEMDSTLLASGYDEIVASGKCGQNVMWKLDTSGVLTVYGSGSMWDKDEENGQGWCDYSPINTIVVEEGVTSIGNCAFYNFNNPSVENVILPQSLRLIGEYAFYGCKIKTLNINDHCYIEDNSFLYCNQLTDIYVWGNSYTFEMEGIPKDVKVHLATIDECSISEMEDRDYTGKEIFQEEIIEFGNIVLEEGKQYVVTYHKNINAGVARVDIDGIGVFKGHHVEKFNILPLAIEGGFNVYLSKDTYTYNGKKHHPRIDVEVNGKLLDEDEYSTEYLNGSINAGKHNILVKLINYDGEKTVTFRVKKKTATPKVTLSKTVFTYNGKKKTPKVTVKVNGKKLSTKDYKITYPKKRTKPGQYKITVRLQRNYSGKKTVKYKILPQKTSLYGIEGSVDKFKVTWYKKTTHIDGYQIQYSTNNKFKNDAKVVNVRNKNTNSVSINKPVKGKEYYVRIRTFKKAGNSYYFSKWSKKEITSVKKCIKAASTIRLRSPESYLEDLKTSKSYTFTTTTRMMFIVPIKIVTDFTYKGGVYITLKDSSGKIHQNDYIDLRNYDMDDVYENWFCNDNYILPPGTYTYTIKNTSDSTQKISYSIFGYSKFAANITAGKSNSFKSGTWQKVGNLNDGAPLFSSIDASNTSVVTEWQLKTNGDLWIWGDRPGTSTIYITLYNGKKYSIPLTVTAGYPDFYARLVNYNTRDNYFVVRVHNYRSSDLTINRTGNYVENVDYKSFDRKIINSSNIVVKGGKTVDVKFPVSGNTTWYDYTEYTLFSKIIFEGNTYEWHVWDTNSVYKRSDGWYLTTGRAELWY